MQKTLTRRMKMLIITATGLMLFSSFLQKVRAQQISRSPISEKTNNSQASPDTFVYASGGDWKRGERFLDQFRINADGKISVINSPIVTPSFNPFLLACDISGKFLYVCNDASKNKIAVYRIQKSGAVTLLHIHHRTSQPSNIIPVSASTGVDVTDMTFRPDGKFVYVTLGGFGSEGFKHGQIVVFRCTSSGDLVEVKNAGLHDLEAPVSTVFSPHGDFAYVVQYGKWLNGYAGHLSIYRVLPDGSLRTTPAQDSVRGVGCVHAETALISTDGHRLYFYARNSMSQYRVSPAGSLHSDVDDKTYAGGFGPVITGDGFTIVAVGTEFETGASLPIIQVIRVSADGKINAPVDYWVRADNRLQREPITRTSAVKPGDASILHITRDDKFIFTKFNVWGTRNSGIAVYSLNKEKSELSFVSAVTLPHEVTYITSASSNRSH